MSKTPADALLERWLAHHASQPWVGAPAAPAGATTPAGTIGPDPAAVEASAPPAVVAPSAIEAGRAVLEAFSHERLEEAARASAAVPSAPVRPLPVPPLPRSAPRPSSGRGPAPRALTELIRHDRPNA